MAESLRQAAAESPVLPNGATDTPIFFISAVSGEGVDSMLGQVIEMMDNLRTQSRGGRG